ncbi:MAG: heme-binding protein, partial [Henriciella sp.]
MRHHLPLRLAGPILAGLALGSCGGGGGSNPDNTSAGPIAPPNPGPQSVYDVPALESLSISDVESIVSQAVLEAEAQGIKAVIAVSDRVGNILAVYQMTDAEPTIRIRPGPNGEDTGFQGLDVPRAAAAISKAVTGAYLSSSGNAFSTRTASMIVQEHFPPGPYTAGLESGPLFGVQFSQLPCSDLMQRFGPDDNLTGPKRAPLGLSADPGGLPLYKNGFVVGGIGISGDDEYGLDPDISDVDSDPEELVAIAGAFGFAAPAEIRAERVSVDGTLLRFTDREERHLLSDPTSAPGLSLMPASHGSLISITGYFDATNGVVAGTAYGSAASGIRDALDSENDNPNLYILVGADGTNRFPPRAGTDGGAGEVTEPLTANEVRVLLDEAAIVMARARAQIRRPLNSPAQVSISIVDTRGQILAVARSPDAPIFGTDVSLQKARTATFFSGRHAADDLLGTTRSPIIAQASGVADEDVNGTVQTARDFLDDSDALTDAFAFADRSGGNLARPYFPDGQLGTINGPLSLPINEWSPFATGLQASLIKDNVLEHATFVVGGINTDTARRCTFLPPVSSTEPNQNRLQNGIQIFPGSVPIYRGNTLVGGIGVSGDGIDQDDMISFLGLHNAGLRLGTINNAPAEIRADQIEVAVGSDSVRLRYISCPF